MWHETGCDTGSAKDGLRGLHDCLEIVDRCSDRPCQCPGSDDAGRRGRRVQLGARKRGAAARSSSCIIKPSFWQGMMMSQLG